MKLDVEKTLRMNAKMLEFIHENCMPECEEIWTGVHIQNSLG